MFCTNCGKEVNEKAIACLSCGFDPKTENKYCAECGAEIQEKQIICIKCGVALKPNLSTSNKKNGFCHSGKINIAAIIFGFLMVISLFLPWISGKFGGDINALDSKFNELIGPFGYVCLLASIGAVISLFFRFRYAIYIGTLYLLMIIVATIRILNIMSSYGTIPFDKFLEGGFGFILAVISVIIFIIITFKELKRIGEEERSKNEPTNYNDYFVKLYQSNYFKFGLPSLLFLISTQFFNSHGFPYIGLLLIAYPVYFAFKRNYKFVFSMLLIMATLMLCNYFFMVINYNSSEMLKGIRDTAFSSREFIKTIFIVFLIVSIIYDVLKEQNNVLIQEIKKHSIHKIGVSVFLFLVSIPFFNSNRFPLMSLLLLLYPTYFVYKEKFRFVFSILILWTSLILGNYFANLIYENLEHSGLLNEILNSFNSSKIFVKASIVLFLVASVLFDALNNKENVYINFIKKYKINKWGWVVVITTFIIPFAIFMFVNSNKLKSLSDNEKQEILKPYNVLQKSWKAINVKYPTYAYDLKIQSADISSDDYGNVSISQLLHFNFHNENLAFEKAYHGSFTDYKFSFPIIYTLSNSEFVIDTLKNDTILGYAKLSSGILKFYAVPIEKYVPQIDSSLLYKSIIDSSYRALENSNFNALNYFAPKVDIYITMKNTTPQKIEEYINKSFYKEFKQLKFSISSEAFSFEKPGNGETKISFIEELNCFRASKQKMQNIRTKTEVIFNSENKIFSWKQLEILYSEFYEDEPGD